MPNETASSIASRQWRKGRPSRRMQVIAGSVMSLTRCQPCRYRPHRVTPPHRGASLLEGRAAHGDSAETGRASGPCAKRPGFTLDALSGAVLGRSHRAREPKARLAEVIERSRAILGMPTDWRLGIVPASDTGAVEMALWSLLGARPVDILAFESFGEGWATDVVKQLRLADARVLSAPYGGLPDLAAVDFRHDVVFPWNGTTSGVRVPNDAWIARDRQGLAICDATSAAFAMA